MSLCLSVVKICYHFKTIRGDFGDTYTVARARKNFYKLIKEVNRQKKPVAIKIADEKTEAVLLSKAEWDSIQETIYLGSVGVIREVRIRKKSGSGFEDTIIRLTKWQV